MSCLTQHKTKEELSNWLMENASDNETTGFLDMLAGEIWDMMEKDKRWTQLMKGAMDSGLVGKVEKLEAKLTEKKNK